MKVFTMTEDQKGEANTRPIDQEKQEAISIETGERFSPREELILLADEWITEAKDEQEKKTLRATKEELLVALDEMRQNYDNPKAFDNRTVQALTRD